MYLSSDGKHTVHVAAETPEAMNELAAYANKLYARVLAQYGTKPQLWEAARNSQSNGDAWAENGSDSEAPRCPEHHKPMAYRKGRYGAFWSCPTRLPDGSWCMYTQQVPPEGNGHKAQLRGLECAITPLLP